MRTLKERVKEQKAANTALEERLSQLQTSNRAVRVKCASLLPPAVSTLDHATAVNRGSLALRGC